MGPGRRVWKSTNPPAAALPSPIRTNKMNGGSLLDSAPVQKPTGSDDWLRKTCYTVMTFELGRGRSPGERHRKIRNNVHAEIRPWFGVGPTSSKRRDRVYSTVTPLCGRS